MKGTKKFFTLLFFSIAVAFTGGCSVPIGSILIDSDEPLDFIRVLPIRFVYRSSDIYKPKEDVEVYGIFGKKQERIPIDEKVDIIFRGFPYSTPDENFVLDDEEKKNGLPLNSEINIVYEITIRYSGMEAIYRISVGKTNGDGGGGDDDSSGIVIKQPVLPDD